MNFRWLSTIHYDGMNACAHGYLTCDRSACALVELLSKGSDTFMNEDADVFAAEWVFDQDCHYAHLFDSAESCIAMMHIRWASNFADVDDRENVICSEFPNCTFEEK